MLLTNQTAVYCQSYEAHKPNVCTNVHFLNVICVICNYCALKGQKFAFIELQYVTVLQDKDLYHFAA